MEKPKRRPIPHASLYASAIVLRHMRELAARRGVKVNDIMLAGLDVIFKQNGLPSIEDLEGLSTDNLSRLIHGMPAREGRVDEPAIQPVQEKETAA